MMWIHCRNRENLKPRKMLKNAQPTHRRVHAVLDGGSRSQADDFSPYFQKAVAAQNPNRSWDDMASIDGNYRLPTTSAAIALLAGET